MLTYKCLFGCRSWGVICLTLAFIWQLYTLYLLVQLHESPETGIRYSRYMQISSATFGNPQTLLVLNFVKNSSLDLFVRAIIANYSVLIDLVQFRSLRPS